MAVAEASVGVGLNLPVPRRGREGPESAHRRHSTAGEEGLLSTRYLTLACAKLLKMLAALVPGGVVTVTRIDRLTRSTFDLFGIVKRIVDAKAHFRSLAEPWAYTGTSTGRLMLAVLGGLADVERGLIRTRTAEGRSRAKDREQHMGRPPHTRAAERGHQTARAGCYAARISGQLRCRHIHHSARDA